MKVLNFGSLNLDYVYDVDHFVLPGETLDTLSRSVKCGGKGLNQSIPPLPAIPIPATWSRGSSPAAPLRNPWSGQPGPLPSA